MFGSIPVTFPARSQCKLSLFPRRQRWMTPVQRGCFPLDRLSQCKFESVCAWGRRWHSLLPHLRNLCMLCLSAAIAMEQTDKAVESLCKIGVQIKERDVVEWFIPLVKVRRQGVLLVFPWLVCFGILIRVFVLESWVREVRFGGESRGF